MPDFKKSNIPDGPRNVEDVKIPRSPRPQGAAETFITDGSDFQQQATTSAFVIPVPEKFDGHAATNDLDRRSRGCAHTPYYVASESLGSTLAQGRVAFLRRHVHDRL